MHRIGNVKLSWMESNTKLLSGTNEKKNAGKHGKNRFFVHFLLEILEIILWAGPFWRQRLYLHTVFVFNL